MGHGISCGRLPSDDHDFFAAVRAGDSGAVRAALRSDPSAVRRATLYGRASPLHVAAANGRLEVLSMLLDRSAHPDLFNRNKQTPMMLAAMRGHIACVQKLLEAGANILMFDSLRGRSCLHYAAYYGHSDCLEAILSAARTTPVTDSWGFARFVNVKDGKGATPLHLAARQRQPNCVHKLLDSGALVCASTDGYGFPGSTPLHLAARGGCLDCVRELLAWGADRLQKDYSGRIPYEIALKRNYGACAALLNPSSGQPLVWPTPLKFISELNPDAKVLLEAALMEANMQREKKILKETPYCSSSPEHSDGGIGDDISEASDSELCCICFDQACTIEVQDCGHQMCAHCTLALCCHNKPNPATLSLAAPVCPFCRSNIARLVVATTKTIEEVLDRENSSKFRRPRKSRNLSEGSSSFKGLSPAMGSLGKSGGGRGSGRIADSSSEMVDKP